MALFKYFQGIEKRQRFVMSTALILALNLVLTLFPFSKIIFFLPILAVLVYAATYFALLEDIKHIEWVVLFILPIYFVLSFLLFYYLLPTRWLTRIPYLLVLSIAVYAILLSENIFNVGVEKSLPLYRAAYSITNFTTLLILFFLFTVLFSFRLHFLLNAFFGGVLAWPVFFHAVWIASPKAVLEERVYKFSTILGVLLSAAILILSFLPIKTSVYAIYTVAVSYVLIGVTQETVQDTAFKERIREYLIVFAAMTVLFLLTAQWG